MNALINGVHPERVAACFRAGGPGGFARRLIKEPRFSERLEALLCQHYHLTDADNTVDSIDRVIAALNLGEMEALSFRAGIVFRARVFIQEIRGPMLAAFAERFGEKALQDARLHHALAGERPLIDELDALEEAVRAEGEACLAAWIATLPEPFSRKLSLKWPDDTAMPSTRDPDILERGPAILRRLGGQIGQPS